MTHERDLDRLLDHWMNEGPTEVADRVILDAAERIERQQQRPAWRSLGRRSAITVSPRLAAAIFAAAIISVAGLAVTGRQPGAIGPLAPSTASHGVALPTAPASPTPTAPLSGTFTSSVHGYTIAVASGQVVEPATIAMPEGTKTWLPDEAFVDTFPDTPGGGTLRVVSQRIPDGVSPAVWVMSRLGQGDGGISPTGCAEVLHRPIAVAEAIGYLRTGCSPDPPGYCDTNLDCPGAALSATVALGDRGYEFVLSGSDRVDREWFLGLLETVRLDRLAEAGVTQPPPGWLDPDLTGWLDDYGQVFSPASPPADVVDAASVVDRLRTQHLPYPGALGATPVFGIVSCKSGATCRRDRALISVVGEGGPIWIVSFARVDVDHWGWWAVSAKTGQPEVGGGP